VRRSCVASRTSANSAALNTSVTTKSTASTDWS
jgi:hypothetical protein